MLSLVSLYVVLAFLALFAALSNIGKAVAQKLEAQNAADAVAASAGVELARGLNAVTTTNHLIGELQALVVLHRALGGDELDGRKQVEPTPLLNSATLTASYYAARFLSRANAPPVQSQYDTVSEDPATGGALRDSRLRLKEVMTQAYVMHAVGGLLVNLGWVPYIGPVAATFGQITVGIALAFETKVYVEWKVLDGLEEVAKALNPIVQKVEQFGVPGLYGFALLQSGQAVLKAEQAAFAIGQRHNVEGSLFPGLTKNTSSPALRLPVEREPANLSKPARSQLVRASTPWIQHWRIPLLRFGEAALTLARFKAFYFDRTDEFTITLGKRQKEEHGVHLLVLAGLDLEGADKTNEPWSTAQGSPNADRLFGTLGFARRPRPPVNAANLFRQGNPDGVVAYAQVMLYNTNPQQRGAGGANQPVAGWDTLNWGDRVPEFTTTDTRGDPPIPNLPEPAIRIGWRAKLVPAMRLHESVFWQQGDLGKVLRRTPAHYQPLSGAH